MSSSRPTPEWFVVGPGRKPFGPYTIEKLRGYAQDGRLARASLVWRTGMASWTRADEVPGIFGAAAPRSSASPVPAVARAASASAPAAVPAAAAAAPTGSAFDTACIAASVVAGILSLAIVVVATVQAVRATGAGGARMLIVLCLVGCVSLPLGWAFVRIGRRLVHNTRARLSSMIALRAPGFLALLLAAIAGVVAGFELAEGGSAAFVIPVLAIVSMLGVFAVFGLLVPATSIGLTIDPDNTLGEDSLALWSVPFRLALASSGAVTAAVQLLACLAGLAALATSFSRDGGTSAGVPPPSDLAIGCASVALWMGFWPVFAYFVAVLHYLVLGTVDSIHAVGRHVRGRKATTDTDGPA